MAIKRDAVISQSLIVLMKVWIWYRSQNTIGNCDHHDGGQFVFYKKLQFKIQSKKKDVLVIFALQETNEL